jgi:hypothetical protein
VEVHVDEDARRNALCPPLIFPSDALDYPQAELANLRVQAVWASEPRLRQWIRDSRLDGFGKVVDGIAPDDAERMAVLRRLRDTMRPAVANLARLAGLADSPR